MNIIDVLFKQTALHILLFKVERVFRRFPHLPLHLMQFLVSILPAIFFALGILHAAIGALIIVTSARLLPQLTFNTGIVSPMYIIINGMLAVSQGIFMLLSFNEIAHTSVSGWRRLVIINSISVIQSLLSILFSPGDI